MESSMINMNSILLVEDDPRDVELTLTALEEHPLANKVVIVNDGAVALDYLYRRGKYNTRTSGKATKGVSVRAEGFLSNKLRIRYR